MAKISRITQLIFGSSAGLDQRGVIGSLAAASPTFSTDPSPNTGGMQSLSNYLEGLFSVVVGGNSPAIEDINSLFYVITYQLAYLMQAGVPEYDAATVYYTNSVCQSGGILYQSLIDSNTGNTPASSPSDWVQLASQQAPTIQKFLSGSGTYTTPAGVRYIRVRMVGGGGGGGGGGQGSFGSGGAGGNTTFGSILTAGGAAGGVSANLSGGAGGTASVTGGTVLVSLNGAQGNAGCIEQTGLPNAFTGGGGVSPFGGAGSAANGQSGVQAGVAAVPNTGSGGSGGGGLAGSVYGGAGGGAGAYIEVMITSPSATYTYAIGAGGTAGSAGTGTGGSAGGVGGSGVIIVEEYYS